MKTKKSTRKNKKSASSVDDVVNSDVAKKLSAKLIESSEEFRQRVSDIAASFGVKLSATIDFKIEA